MDMRVKAVDYFEDSGGEGEIRTMDLHVHTKHGNFQGISATSDQSQNNCAGKDLAGSSISSNALNTQSYIHPSRQNLVDISARDGGAVAAWQGGFENAVMSFGNEWYQGIKKPDRMTPTASVVDDWAQEHDATCIQTSGSCAGLGHLGNDNLIGTSFITNKEHFSAQPHAQAFSNHEGWGLHSNDAWVNNGWGWDSDATNIGHRMNNTLELGNNGSTASVELHLDCMLGGKSFKNPKNKIMIPSVSYEESHTENVYAGASQSPHQASNNVPTTSPGSRIKVRGQSHVRSLSSSPVPSFYSACEHFFARTHARGIRPHKEFSASWSGFKALLSAPNDTNYTRVLERRSAATQGGNRVSCICSTSKLHIPFDPLEKPQFISEIFDSTGESIEWWRMQCAWCGNCFRVLMENNCHFKDIRCVLCNRLYVPGGPGGEEVQQQKASRKHRYEGLALDI